MRTAREDDMRTTHSYTKVREVHKGKGYMVYKRTKPETARLQLLAEDLFKAGEWTIERNVAGRTVRINVDAVSVREAKREADEVAYALRWKAGVIDKRTSTPPEEWALSYSDYTEVRK